MPFRPLSRRAILKGGLTMAASTMARSSAAISNGPEPFSVAIPQQRIDEITYRVRTVRWPQTAQGVGWSLGVDAAWFRDLVDYWGTGYQWSQQEAGINRMPQFTAPVMGRQLHFVHQRSHQPAARPLVLVHGWPYSFYSFSKLLPLLSDDFHLVIPSLPGFVFSEPAADAPRGLRHISRHIHALMTDVLGYSRYFVSGGDFGAVVA